MRGQVLISQIITFSLVFAPLAEAQQKANWASQELKRFVQSHTNKDGSMVTLGEFWKKNKANFSQESRDQMAPFVEIQKNEKLPKMEVIDIKGSKAGQDSARLILNQGGKTVSIEYIGKTEAFARINGIIVSEEDMSSPSNLMQKLAKDPVIAADSKAARKKLLEASIIPSYEVFTKMSARGRAAYFVNVRLLLEAASQVQENALKVSYNNQKSSPFVDLILEKAYAQGKGNNPRDWIGKTCIVAGYVGEYALESGKPLCSHTKAVSKLAQGVIDYQASQKNIAKSVYSKDCGSGQFRCNPFVYGFERSGGQSLCVKVGTSPEFQQATKTCDDRSPLRKDSLAADSRAMIETLLAKEGKDKSGYFGADGKLISKEKYNELRNTILKDFNSFIDAGLDTCVKGGFYDSDKNTLSSNGIGEKNQPIACQVLTERKLAFNEGLAKLGAEFGDSQVTPAPIGDNEGAACNLEPGRGVIKNGVCVPVGGGEVAPKPVDKCRSEHNQMMVDQRYHDENGVAVTEKCNPTVAFGPPVASSTSTAVTASSGSSSKWWIPIGIIGAWLLAFKFLPKAGKQQGPTPNKSPAPPPLPGAPAQPVTPTPVPAPIEGDRGNNTLPAGGARP